MKKLFMAIMVVLMTVSVMVLANPKMNKSHVGKKGKGEAKINCVYCHKTAGIAKKKGQDVEAHKKNALCAIGKCHAK